MPSVVFLLAIFVSAIFCYCYPSSSQMCNWYFLQFADETFDVVLDKGGLDALMEPEFGPKLGSQYLSEVNIPKYPKFSIEVFKLVSCFMSSKLVLVSNELTQFSYNSHDCLVYHQVKRVLKSGGKFICLTLAESHVLGMVYLYFMWVF